MLVISKKSSTNSWLYLMEHDPYCDNCSPIASQYGWTPTIRYAKIFESPEEAKIFWKVIKDKGLSPEYDGKSDLAIRKILFKKEKNFELV